MKKHYDIRVKGHVQGVWFRKNTKEIAKQLGILGFVRNEVDGSVFIEAEGGPEALNEFVEWCRNGPELATVDDVSVSEREPVGHRAFMIKH